MLLVGEMLLCWKGSLARGGGDFSPCKAGERGWAVLLTLHQSPLGAARSGAEGLGCSRQQSICCKASRMDRPPAKSPSRIRSRVTPSSDEASWPGQRDL